jgi:signal transduction histidine kinase
MSALLEKIVGQAKDSLGTHHQIELVVPPELPMIELDERIFRYMILNLLTNALKYSSPGSKVAVQVRMTSQGVQVMVQDAGIGIPNADLPHLFEPFQRGQNVRAIGGTGLGLKIVKDCVEMHHGSVKIDSIENVGTTVTVTLPTKASQYPTPPPP